MKRLLWTALCLLLTLSAAAQTRQGYVKTKGRLVNGKVVPGQRIVGATVQVKGLNAVISRQSGSFSFPIPAAKFSIQSVKKQGYILSDPDILTKQYSYSTNPLILVMELPNQQADDKLTTERKLRRTLSRQLQQREDEIEQLKEQNSLTEEQYHHALQDLYAEQERSLNLVSQMAERYAKIDFDQLDEFNRHVSECIIEGRLAEADSLIKSKGDLKDRIAIHNRHHESNIEARKRLETSEAMELKDLHDIAEDCYNQFLIHKLRHHPDSAAYYIDQRALLDTTNVDWLYEAACYLKECSKNVEARNLFIMADRQFDSSGSEDLLKHALILQNIADLRKTIEEAIDYYDRAIAIFTQINQNHPELIGCYYKLAQCYFWLTNVGEIDSLSGEYRKKSREIAYGILDNIDSIDGTDFYLGSFPMIDESRVIKYYEKALKKIIFHDGEESEKTVEIFMKLGDYDEPNTLSHYKTAYRIQAEIDSLHPVMGVICEKLGSYHRRDLKDPLTAIQYFWQAISVWQKNYGDFCGQLGYTYVSMGHAYDDAEDHLMAIICYQKAIDVKKRIYGKNAGGDIYGTISRTYRKMGEYEKAIEYRENEHQFDGELKVRIMDKKECVFYASLDHDYFEDLGDLYYLLKNYQKSMESYSAMLSEIDKEKQRLSSRSRSFGLYNAEAKGNGCLGTIYHSMGDSIKALECYKNSIRAFALSMGKDSLEMINDFKLYSDELFSLGTLNDALPVYMRLLNLIINANTKKYYSEWATEILTRIDDFQNQPDN